MVEHKIFRIETKWKETNLLVTSPTGKRIRKDKDKTTCREVTMKNFEYYYNLEEVCSNRAVYCPKATNRGITATGYVPIVAVASSDSNALD